MASPISSDPSPDPSPPAIPLYGTSWYERGVSYWLRRAWFAVAMLLLTAFAGFVVLSLCRGFAEAVLPPAARTAFGVLEGITACAGVAWGWTRQQREYGATRREIEQAPDQDPLVPERRAHQAVPGPLAGRALVVLLAPLVLPLIAYFLGLVLAAAFTREMPSELRARRTMEQRRAPAAGQPPVTRS